MSLGEDFPVVNPQTRTFHGLKKSNCSICNKLITTKTKGNISGHTKSSIKCGPCYLKHKRDQRRKRGKK